MLENLLKIVYNLYGGCMDKDVIIDKLKDLLNFLICVAIILAIAYFSGFLKGFTPADFQEAFSNLTGSVPQKGAGNVQTRGQHGVRYNNYLASKIPDNVMRGAKSTPAWYNVLTASGKSVFYVYDDDPSNTTYHPDFHLAMQKYISKSPVKTKYNVYAYPLYMFKNIKTGEVGPDKICNSLEECKAQRQKAVDYEALQSFFLRCSKTMCVINPQRGEYVVLKKRDYASAVQMLNGLANW